MSKFSLRYLLIGLMLVFLFAGNVYASTIVRDDFIEETLKKTKIEKPETNLDYNYESFERIPVKLQIIKPVSTKKDDIFEGQVLDFCVKENVLKDGKIIIKKGTKATGVVQTYMTRGLNGIPATIIVDDFTILGIDKRKVKATYIKRGQNRTLIVFPIKWVLTPIPGAGYTTNLILGGHAKITKKSKITLYYYPKWNETIKK